MLTSLSDPAGHEWPARGARRKPAVSRLRGCELDRRAAPLLLSPFVLAELDYLLAARVGPDAQSALLAEVERGAHTMAPMTTGDIGKAPKNDRPPCRCADRAADASSLVLAERHCTRDV